MNPVRIVNASGSVLVQLNGDGRVRLIAEHGAGHLMVLLSPNDVQALEAALLVARLEAGERITRYTA